MSWTFLRQNKRKANRLHYCHCCNEPIEKGDSYTERVGADSGDICTMRMHDECEKYSSDWEQEDWETFEVGSMNRPNPKTSP